MTYPPESIWSRIAAPGMPLGLGYLASYLRQGGVHVSLLDANREGLDASRLWHRLPNSEPEIVG